MKGHSLKSTLLNIYEGLYAKYVVIINNSHFTYVYLRTYYDYCYGM